MTLGRTAIKVAEVQPGAETELRHFLESVALQVNSELDQPEPTKDAVGQAEAENAAHTDRQMTAAFRSFADAD